MSQELTTVDNSYNPFLAAADDLGARTALQYTKFDGNTGHFQYGKDGTEISHGTRVAFNHNEVKNGWICWDDGKVKEEVMVNILKGAPPAEDTLKDHSPNGDGNYTEDGDGWSKQSSIQFKSLEDGKEFEYKTSSKSGLIAVGNLVKAFGQQYPLRQGKLAILEIGAQGFDAKDAKGKKLGKKYAPSFKIVGWESEDSLIAAETEQDEVDDVVEAQPQQTLAPPQRRARF